jgi:hypothetical protein
VGQARNLSAAKWRGWKLYANERESEQENTMPSATLDKIEFDTPDWVPLRLWANRTNQPWLDCWPYVWVYRKDGLEHYKHSLDRHYLALDQNGLTR